MRSPLPTNFSLEPRTSDFIVQYPSIQSVKSRPGLLAKLPASKQTKRVEKFLSIFWFWGSGNQPVNARFHQKNLTYTYRLIGGKRLKLKFFQIFPSNLEPLTSSFNINPFNPLNPVRGCLPNFLLQNKRKESRNF